MPMDYLNVYSKQTESGVTKLQIDVDKSPTKRCDMLKSPVKRQSIQSASSTSCNNHTSSSWSQEVTKYTKLRGNSE